MGTSVVAGIQSGTDAAEYLGQGTVDPEYCLPEGESYVPQGRRKVWYIAWTQ